MGLRRRIMELLQRGESGALERLAADDRRCLRYLLGRLWDTNDQVRRRAAAAIGAAAAAHPDLGVDVLRRLMWGLNDESATNGVYGVPAFAEIAARAPELAAPFVGPLVSYLWDEGLRAEILRALVIIAGTAPQLVEPFLDDIRLYNDPPFTQLVEGIDSLVTGGFHVA
jgi:hypothetical protein